MVRTHNEDSVFVDADAGIAVLADGMGATTRARSQAASRSRS
jgi:serine/threonine protein phosphatase PrpC